MIGNIRDEVESKEAIARATGTTTSDVRQFDPKMGLNAFAQRRMLAPQVPQPPTQPSEVTSSITALESSQSITVPAAEPFYSDPPPLDAGTQAQTQFWATITSGALTINPASILRKSFGATDYLAISNISASFSTTSADKLWVEITGTFSSYPFSYTGAVLKSLGNGDSYGGGEFEHDGGIGSPPVYTIKKVRVPIVTTTTGPIIATQYITSSLHIEDAFQVTAYSSTATNPQSVLGFWAFSG